ncbi:hypothetical protein ABIE48_005784 [Paenibacillus sp. OAE614]
MILFPHHSKYLNMGINTWEVTTIPRKLLLKLFLRRRALILPSALLAIVLLLTTLPGCGSRESGNTGVHETVRTGISHSWAFPFIRWDSRLYRLTELYSVELGTRLGTVETYADVEGLEYHGTYSNKYEVGTGIFSIQGTAPDQAIAVQTGNGIDVLIESTLKDPPDSLKTAETADPSEPAPSR